MLPAVQLGTVMLKNQIQKLNSNIALKIVKFSELHATKYYGFFQNL